MKKILFVIAITILSANYAHIAIADEERNIMVTQLALQEMVDNCLECYIFYTITVEGSNRKKGREWEEGVEKFQKIADMFLQTAFVLASRANIANEALVAKAKMYMDTMSDEMHNNYANFSILIDKYGQPCKFLAEHPEKVFATELEEVEESLR